MKKKINIYFIIILIVSIIDITYGVLFQIEESKYRESSIPIKANIHQITTNKNVNTLYYDFTIKDKMYNGVITTTNKDIKVSDHIELFCEEGNMLKCNDGKKNYSGIYIIALGFIILFMDFIFSFRNVHNKLNKN